MNSTDFGSLVGPTITGMDRRHLKRGGPVGKPHHLTIVVAQPAMAPPIMGALMQAMLLHRMVKRGALEAAQRQRRRRR